MTDVAIDQLTLRCHAEAGAGQRALATRRRLENIARSFLPGALEQSLGDLDVSIDRLDVAIDFDVAQYDDSTVATLWASRVRRAVTDQAPLLEPGLNHSAPSASGHLSAGQAAAGDIDLCVHLAMETAAGVAGHFPQLIALLHQDWLARELFNRLTPSQRHAVIEALETWLQDRSMVESPVQDLGEPPTAGATRIGSRLGVFAGAAAAEAENAGILAEPDWRRWWQLAAQNSLSSTRLRSDLQPTTQLGDTSPQREDVKSSPQPTLMVSGAGGLLLMWPWLQKLSTRAGQALPIDPVAARRLALAAAVGTDSSDPLVGLLAGDHPAERPAAIHVTKAQALAIDQAAEWCVAAFTAAIAGFEKSSRQFIVDELLRRRAQFRYREHAEVVSVLLEPRPLDIVLDRLPFPLTVLRLPWTPLISVERGP